MPETPRDFEFFENPPEIREKGSLVWGLEGYLKTFCKSDECDAEVRKIITGLTKARRRIMAMGGPVLFNFRMCGRATPGAHCSDCELGVDRSWPIVGTKYFTYQTKTKQQGLDHAWGEILFDGTPVATIDFWQDDIYFWAPGENGFGYIADEDAR